LGPDRGGLTGDETNPGPPPSRETGESTAVRRVYETGDTAIAFDPPHGLFRVVRDQIHGGAMDGFVSEFALKKKNVKDKLRHREWRDADIKTPMAFYGRDTLPSYRFLIERALVCARYFASAPSGTWVNRMFFYAGTSGGLADNPDGAIVRGDDYQKHMPSRLLVDVLEDKGVSWGVYADGVAWMRLFRNNDLPEARVHDFRRHFADHCRDGTLPKVVFVDPNPAEGIDARANDDHAPIDLLNGQDLVRDVYNALLTLQDNQRTVLVVTYDEHGGFFDHVPPPEVRGWRPEPYFTSAGDLPTGGDPYRNDPFRRYGIRVPCFVVSRYVPAGVVVTDEEVVLDHASIHASIHRVFLPDEPFLSLRVEAAQTLGRLLSLDDPRPPLPGMPAPATRARRARPLAPLPLGVGDEPDRDESARVALARLSRRREP
jgi:phospholipase C